jgi:hypothetical protein
LQDGTIPKQNFGEIQYFFQAICNDETVTLALVSLYSPPDTNLLTESYGTLWSCKYQGHDDLVVVDAKAILSVVAMVPLPFPLGDIEIDTEQDTDSESGEYFFVVEKPGLEVFAMGGYEETPEAGDEE